MATLDLAIPVVLEHEGGYQADPNDHANWSSGRVGDGTLVGTKYGITALDKPGITAEQMKDLAVSDAEAFYKAKGFWKPLYDQINGQAVATKIFDMSVLFGVREAVKCIQRAMTVTPDGDFGDLTLGVINSLDPNDVLYVYRIELVKLAQEIGANNPLERKNVQGWINRINL